MIKIQIQNILKTGCRFYKIPVSDEAPMLFHGIIPDELNNLSKGQHTVEKLVTAGC